MRRLLPIAIRMASFTGALTAFQGCASWLSAQGDLVPGGSNAVPPAAEVAAPRPTLIGENVVARHGGDIGTQPSAAAVAPAVTLMLAPPSHGAPGMALSRPGYARYPPPPSLSYASAPELSEVALERAIMGGLIGAILGAQLRSGGGKAGATGLGAATGALVGLGTSGNPCAAPNGGAIAGAVVGGILGHQVGSGNGRNAATAVGAALGAIAGTRAGTAQPDCR